MYKTASATTSFQLNTNEFHFYGFSMCVICLFLLFQTPAWLEQMIAHTTWRDLFYKLAEAHPDCLMLNFTVKVTQNSQREFVKTAISFPI